MKISAYTIANNCTDTTDCKAGIKEIRNEIRIIEAKNGKVPMFYYTRLGKLKDKLAKYKSTQSDDLGSISLMAT